MKKDKEWAKEEIKKERNLLNDTRYEREVDDLTTGILLGLKKALNIIDQLDEPEEHYEMYGEEEVKKDLNWFKEQLDDIEMNTPRLRLHDSVWMLDRVHELLNQLDEPETLSEEWIDDHKLNRMQVDDNDRVVSVTDLRKALVPKRELPVIPKFVADWVESRDYYNVYKVLQDLSAPGSPHASKEVRNWIFRNQENVEKFVRAWLDGFTVKGEQKYYVLSKELHPMLCKSAGTDKKTMESTTQLTINEKGLYKEQYALTEQEIKDYDPRYFSFAVKVGESGELI